VPTTRRAFTFVETSEGEIEPASSVVDATMLRGTPDTLMKRLCVSESATPVRRMP
jgi:hypothetical protein